MKAEFSENKPEGGSVLVIPVFNGNKLGTEAKDFDESIGGFVQENLKFSPKFEGKRGEFMELGAPVGSPYKKIALLGMGNAEVLDDKALDMIGSAAFEPLTTLGFSHADFIVEDDPQMPASKEKAAAVMANAMIRKSYKFDKYKSDQSSQSPSFDTVQFQGVDAKKAKAIFKPLSEVTKGAFFAADLANEPPNVLYPESYADKISQELMPHGVKVTVLDENDMKSLGMNSALAVGQGSERPPRMVVMEYDGTNGSKRKPLALVGKGITFDTGGISLKPGANMDEMKMDMGGSAAVVGAMRALAGRKANAKVVAIVALAENMPDGKAQRPGDVWESMSGKTVEVLNTDAEGRMVLIDALTYIQNEFDPDTVIDLATLTGAVSVALGKTFAGVFTNNDGLYKKLNQAGQTSGEVNWRLPLHEDFQNAIKGKTGDMLNTGGRYAGASTAAEFLHAVIDTDDNGVERKWAHIDIAGVARPFDGVSKGYGVHMLNQFVADNFESKSKKPQAPKP